MKFKLLKILLALFLCSYSVLIYAQIIKIPDSNLAIGKNIPSTTKNAAQTTSFDRETIKQSPVIDLTQLLNQDQSIVRVTNNSGDYSQVAFSIRGFGDNAVANSLVIVDGFPLTNPSLLAPYYNSILLSDIQEIEITQGSEGVLWGDQAVGGVVSIVTRHPEKKLFDANLGLGSFSKQYYSLLVGDKFRNGVFLKAFGYTNQTENYRQHNDQKDENIMLQGGLDYASGSLRVSAQNYEDSIQFPGGLTQQQYDENPRQATDLKNYINFKTPVYQLLNKQFINDDWLIETRLQRHETIGSGVMFSGFDRYDIENMYRFRLLGKIKNVKTVLGYEGLSSQYEFQNSRVAEQAESQQNNIFIKNTIPLYEHLALIAGTRMAWQRNHYTPDDIEWFDNLDKVTVSEVGLRFKPTHEWSYFVRRSGNFRFAKANEETWLPDGVDSLKPQTGVSYEVGGERKTQRQKTQLNIYQLTLYDEIAFNPTQTPAEPFGSYSNFPKTVRTGMTLTEYYYLTKKLLLNSQLNWVNAVFSSGEFSGNQIPAVPSFNANIGAAYDFMTHWRIKYSGLYTGSAYASENAENTGRKIPSYWINTMALQYMKKSYDINFEIINLLNQQYPVYTLYNVDTHENTYYPGAGRSYLLTFKVDLS